MVLVCRQVVEPPVESADLEIISVDDHDLIVSPGTNLIYDIDYRNNGPNTANGIKLTATIPDSATFNNPNSSLGWVATGPSTYEITVGTLVSGQTGNRAISLDVKNPIPAGINDVTLSVSIADNGATVDSVPGNDSGSDVDTLTGAPDMYITKDDGEATTTPGAVLVYVIDYGNSGNRGAEGVVITETPSAKTTFNPGASSPGWTGTGPYTMNIGVVEGGDSGSVNFAVTVNLAETGQIENNVSITQDGNNGLELNVSNNQWTDFTNIV